MREALIVAAEPGELAGILANCAGVARGNLPVWFSRTGKLNGVRITAVANGPGRKLAAAAVDAAGGADIVVSTGYCGALDPALAPGDVFVASSVNGVPCELPTSVRPHRTGDLASVDRVVTAAAEKRRLHTANGHSPMAVEMEAAAVAEAARARGAAFYCIRAVLDAAGESLTLDFNRLRDAEGRFSRPRITAAALARPWSGVAELFRLNSRGRRCSRALGDFFADCRF